ncbi:MAG: hypothetical protein ACE5Q6_27365 [Dehalococcoidia bacterium]
MTKHVEETVNRYMEEMKNRHPGVSVELLDGQSRWVDAHLRISCSSHGQVEEVMESTAHLTTKYYLDDGVYITASESFSGPMS